VLTTISVKEKDLREGNAKGIVQDCSKKTYEYLSTARKTSRGKCDNLVNTDVLYRGS
jgi:hypothetical protein